MHIEKEKTSLKSIHKEHTRDLIAGLSFSIGVIIIVVLMKFLKQSLYSLLLITLLILFLIISMVFLLSWLIDLVNIAVLKKNGSFVEFQSKEDILKIVFSFFKKEKNENFRRVGKIYKNINGEIYKIRSVKCPYCESEPKGVMHLFQCMSTKEYLWICSEQIIHKGEFDYKREF